MKILQVVESCSAGVGRHVRGLCEGLAEEGHEVTLVYASRRTDGVFKQFVSRPPCGVECISLNLERSISPVSDLVGLFQLLRIIRRHGPFDVVHGHSSKGGALARIAGCLVRVPTVYTPHGLVMATDISRAKLIAYSFIERVLGRFATSAMIAVSKGEQRFVLQLGLLDGSRLFVVNNGLSECDFDRFSDVCGESSKSLERESPLVYGTLMRLSPEKMPGQLLDSFIRLSLDLPSISMQLVIAGDGELFSEVEQRVMDSGSERLVSLPGWIEDPTKVLSEIDIYVLASYTEAGSYALLEAMAAGLPVISTDVSGTEETLAQVPGNIIVPVGNLEALHKGMEQMAGYSRLTLSRIGQANREYVRGHFTQSRSTRRTIEIYRDLC